MVLNKSYHAIADEIVVITWRVHHAFVRVRGKLGMSPGARGLEHRKKHARRHVVTRYFCKNGLCGDTRVSVVDTRTSAVTNKQRERERQ